MSDVLGIASLIIFAAAAVVSLLGACGVYGWGSFNDTMLRGTVSVGLVGCATLVAALVAQATGH